ncbi:MAG: hypothetical protein Hyperionvirus5_17 [Hyperionvirus sp.]|uniref:Uncharacterized protein n=1 Tax=Hyperionvirus sp. TaxID=2487770 RepID=A0A3G5AAH0_9VIRU|nr:MAG: hypothetical protein Hyperionvirus5_17 [Hyperionvirus sp.]
MKGILYIGTTYSIGRSLDKLYNSGFLEDIYRENQLNLIMGMHHYPPWRSARINGLIKCLLAIACHYYYHTKKGTKLDIILLSIYLTKKILFQSDDLLLFQKIIESM